MYLEVTSMTFPVHVRTGSSLSQLRLFYGHPDQSTMRGEELGRTIGSEHEFRLRVHLDPVRVGDQDVVAFRAKKLESSKAIDLWKGALKPDPCDYWTFCRPNPQRRLRLAEDAFYILRSKERLALPGGVAAYCRAIDETIGEMRIHYAGFVHPWFGRNRADGRTGTPLIFEVRGHDLSVHLLDNEVMARMTIYRMSMDVPKPEEKESIYEEQQLDLSGYFGRWPNTLHMDDDGNVTPG
jgi:dCTP deaminase